MLVLRKNMNSVFPIVNEAISMNSCWFPSELILLRLNLLVWNASFCRGKG